MKILHLFYFMIQQELRLHLRSYTHIFYPLFFYLLAIVLFTLAIGHQPSLLRNTAAAVLWLPILFVHFMNLNQLFMTELENGIYEQWLLSPISLTLLVLGKMIAHWLLFSAPLILLAPLLGYTLLQLNSDVCIAVGLSLLLATPTLALLGGIIAALTANLRDSSLLLPLVLLPLCIPSLIFGVGVVTYALQQSPYQGLLALLAAQAVLTLTLAPIAIASALRLSVQT